MAKAWVAHAAEVDSLSGLSAPFRGDPREHIERLVTAAARSIHGFLVRGALIWQPGMPARGGTWILGRGEAS